MPAPPPILYPVNAIEGAILTMTPDGPEPGFGVERLVDRDIGLECRDQGTSGTRVWHADRGASASALTIGAWIFAGRNYAGAALTLETSADNISWTVRGAITPTADVPQRVMVTPFVIPRFVRVWASGLAAPIYFTEWFLSPAVMFTWKPAAPALTEPHIPNVVILQSQSGRSWGIRRGSSRWSTSYTMLYSPDSDRVKVLALLEAIRDGVDPFWLFTVTSELRWVRVSGGVSFQAADRSLGQWDVPLVFIEELP